MEKWHYLGQGFEPGKPGYPYDVAIYTPATPYPEFAPIALSEGSGFMSAGGAFPLADMLDDKWTSHLELCGCLYLRDLARQQQQEGRIWTADEIWEKWQARPS